MTEQWFETAFGSHYPLLYRHRDQAEAERCLKQLANMASLGGGASSLILDLGCGDGRHLELLAGRGLRAVGLDLSADLLRYAQGRTGWPSPPVLARGDLRNLPFLPASVGTVLSLFTAFGYFGSPDQNGAPVREIARVLQPGGHWFLDYFDGDAVRRELAGGQEKHRNRTLGPVEVVESRRLAADRSVVAKRVHLVPVTGKESEAAEFGVGAAGVRYTEEVAVFTRKQLVSLAEGQGLEPVAAAGGYEGQEIGQGSRWILVFRKAPNTANI